MYIIDVRFVSDILPRIFAVNFEPHPSYLGAIDIALTLAPESDAEKAFQLFPEYIREGRRSQIHEIEYSEIDWGLGRSQTAEGRCHSKLQEHGTDAEQEPMTGELEDGQL